MFEFAVSQAFRVVETFISGTEIVELEVKVKVYSCESPGNEPDAIVEDSIKQPPGATKKYLPVFSFTTK
jgi:hypothetical protein